MIITHSKKNFSHICNLDIMSMDKDLAIYSHKSGLNFMKVKNHDLNKVELIISEESYYN